MPEPTLYRFGAFTLDVPNRELRCEGDRLDLNARYFDALVLLVQEHGQLVEKDRFFEDVWSDVVVSDSALTQCVKEIRRLLGDDASNPRFIQTVPRHGYRFISAVSAHVRAPERDAPAPAYEAVATPGGGRPAAIPLVAQAEPTALSVRASDSPFGTVMASALAGLLGGGVAGVMGGLLYGIGLASSSMAQEVGTASVLLVLVSLSGFLGTMGGFGIGAGMAAADYASDGQRGWRIVGAVLGGMLVGGSVKLLGVDAFNLLFGRTPAGITGGLEGAALGLAVGLGAHLGSGLGATIRWRPIATAAVVGAVIGVLIALSGGHLLGGSLSLLADSFAESRLQLDAFGRYFGEVRFGQTTQVVLAGLEGLIFTVCVVGALGVSQPSKKTSSGSP